MRTANVQRFHPQSNLVYHNSSRFTMQFAPRIGSIPQMVIEGGRDAARENASANHASGKPNSGIGCAGVSIEYYDEAPCRHVAGWDLDYAKVVV